jgi:deazaflavin-dependent oxidoreductase (nitroreductase family)
MGIAEDLGYHHRPPNAAQRTVQAFGASRPGAWFFSHTLRVMDRWAQRATGGRHTMPGLLAGLPVLGLTTTGRRSGAARTSYLLAIPYRDSLTLLGTNFGQASTPAWVLNLEADPSATLTFRGRSAPVVSRLATPDEHAEVLACAERVYVGYRRYQERITDRRLRIFVLEPGPEPAARGSEVPGEG